MLVRALGVGHISSNYVKFMKDLMDTDYDPDETTTSNIKHRGHLPILHTHTHTFRDGPPTIAIMVWDVL
jgi:hypothetical protein